MVKILNAILWKIKITRIRKNGVLIKIVGKKKTIVIEDRLRILTGSRIQSDTGMIKIGSGLICEYSKLLACNGYIDIGTNVQIGDFCLFTGQGGITIGNNVLFASHVSIIANEHSYEQINIPIIAQDCYSKTINIGDDCWFGIKSTILSGSTIGKHCVIGANSVVKGHFPDYCVIAGSPAKIIKRYDEKSMKWKKT